VSTVRIAHLSDPHFGTVFPEVERALLICLRELNPQAIIFTGDITQRALKAQFLAARAFKEKIQPIPVHAVPGNHDIPLYNIFSRAFAPYRGFEKYFQCAREGVFSVNGVEVVALNSSRPWRHIQGAFSASELQRNIHPRDASVNFRIAAFHHPMDCMSTRDEENLIRGREEILPVLESKGFDLVLCGHIHDPHVSLSINRYPDSQRPIVLATAGTCLSWRTRFNAPNSFHLIELNAGVVPSLKITRHELDKNKVFSATPSRFYERGEQGDWKFGENNENQSTPHFS